jgi:hypothetical protein
MHGKLRKTSVMFAGAAIQMVTRANMKSQNNINKACCIKSTKRLWRQRKLRNSSVMFAGVDIHFTTRAYMK